MNVSRARVAIPFLALALPAGPALTGCSSTALAEGVFDTINAQLLEAGFTTDFSGIREEDGTGYGTYDDGKHNVTLSTGTESADGQMVAIYLISATTR
jgi:hypothetical protein